MVVMATIEAKNEVAGIIIAPPARRGRPPATIEEKKVRDDLKKSDAYQATRKEYQKVAVKKSHMKALEQKKWQCPFCQKCYPTRQGLEYHTKISKVHKAQIVAELVGT